MLAEGEELSSNPLRAFFNDLRTTQFAVDVAWRIRTLRHRSTRRLAVRRHDPRGEPGALAAHAGICAGGGDQNPCTADRDQRTGESGAVLEGGHRAGASADLAEAALDRVVVRTAMRSRCGSISRFIRPRSSSATARRAPWRSSARHSNPSACMAFIIRNAAGRLLVVAVSGIGVLHLADLNHSAEYPLPLLTQTLVCHCSGRAP
jgi:hypothetical protein